jgi:hypothetical protein
LDNSDMLDHGDCICAVGDGSSGHDLAGRSGGKRRGRRIARANRACKREKTMRGRFCGAAGKAIARGTGEGRLIAVSTEGMGQYPASSVSQINPLNRGHATRQARGTLGDQSGGFVEAEQRGRHGKNCRA